MAYIFPPNDAQLHVLRVLLSLAPTSPLGRIWTQKARGLGVMDVAAEYYHVLKVKTIGARAFFTFSHRADVLEFFDIRCFQGSGANRNLHV